VKKVDVHLVAATNRDLRSEVDAGRFREDLFYRLSTIEIRVPGLVERSEDIPLLVRYFLKRSNEQYGKRIRGLTRGAEAALARYPWPGNVRELENAISGAAITCTGDFLDLADLPKHIQNGSAQTNKPADTWRPATLEEVERVHVQRVLEMCEGNQVRAAELLGIGRTSLYRHLKRTAGRASKK
jgi:two-component system response regulator HydG